ncbi:DUF6303 family protein [Streptomyces sp. B15]|uniref:DUF6303 family protein n=1 Tax=Streptomyces sp. B15 TaxID=1537797 RepID=UPI001B38B72A|nr:DUF6303 family protein [Streptomyces sp. B15]MBQ1118635.1 hypothetical protein [Streptomyces sp. B15]
MAETFTAQMSNVPDGTWRLYVVRYNTTAPWPEYRFEQTQPPTFTDRIEAFNLLGFEPVPGAGWTWVEDRQDPDDAASPVVLIAAIRVRSCSGVVA